MFNNTRTASLLVLHGLCTLFLLAGSVSAQFEILVDYDPFQTPVEARLALATPVDDITSWVWSFGDGTTSDQEAPVHLYEAVGLYPVQVTVHSASLGTVTVTAAEPVAIGNGIVEDNFEDQEWSLGYWEPSPWLPISLENNLVEVAKGQHAMLFTLYDDGNQQSSSSPFLCLGGGRTILAESSGRFHFTLLFEAGPFLDDGARWSLWRLVDVDGTTLARLESQYRQQQLELRLVDSRGVATDWSSLGAATNATFIQLAWEAVTGNSPGRLRAWVSTKAQPPQTISFGLDGLFPGSERWSNVEIGAFDIRGPQGGDPLPGDPPIGWVLIDDIGIYRWIDPLSP